jgi:tetratricopeptide (TPR) repeat protein
MLDHYLFTAHAATLRVDPTREQITLPPPAPGAAPEQPADDRRAWRWFEAERAVLLGVVTLAADERFDTHAWQLAWALVPFFTRQGHPHDHVTTQTVAVTAAGRSCGPLARASAHRGLGLAQARLAEYDDAYANLRRSLELYRGLDDGVGQARSHNSLAWTLERQGRHEAAIDHARQALSLYRDAGNRIGQATALNAIGWSESQLGDHEQALIHCQEALDLHRDLEAHDDEAGTLDSIGYAYHHLGRYPQARASFREAVDLFRGLGDRQNQAIALDHLADTHLAMADRDAARDAWRQAICILADMEDGDIGPIRAKLARLTGGC